MDSAATTGAVEHDVVRLSQSLTGELIEHRCSCGRWWSTEVGTCPGDAEAQGASSEGTASATSARRLHWQIFHENGVGVLLTDLDTEEWSSGSAPTEAEARGVARWRLDERPSGRKAPGGWSQDSPPMPLSDAWWVLTAEKHRLSGRTAEALKVVLKALELAPTVPVRADG